MPVDIQETYELESRVLTDGDDATATVLEFQLYQCRRGAEKAPVINPFDIRLHLCNAGTHTNSSNGLLAVGTGRGVVRTTHTATKDLTIGSPKAGAAAAKVFTFTDVGIDGETITVNGLPYYLSTGLTEVPALNTAVDLSAAGTKASGTVTLALVPSAGETITVGATVYTWRTTANVAGDITIGANVAAAKVNFVAALNGDALNTANASASCVTPTAEAPAFVGDDCTLTARYTGVQGDSIALAETMAGVGNVVVTFATASTGVDPSIAECGAALETAVNAHAAAAWTASDAAGTVTFTYDLLGATGNDITLAETCANGAWDGGATALSGGVSNDPSKIRVTLTNTTTDEAMELRRGMAAINGAMIDYTVTDLVTHEAA